MRIKGRVNSSGELDASRITFKRNAVRIEAEVNAVNNDGSVNMLGVTVQNVGKVNVGDYLEVRGFIGAKSNTLIAKRTKTRSSRNRAVLRSVANVVNAGNALELLGVTVIPDNSTTFQDRSGAVISKEAFFAKLTSGLTVVKAKWKSFTSTNVAPKELELEDFSN